MNCEVSVMMIDARSIFSSYKKWLGIEPGIIDRIVIINHLRSSITDTTVLRIDDGMAARRLWQPHPVWVQDVVRESRHCLSRLRCVSPHRAALSASCLFLKNVPAFTSSGSTLFQGYHRLKSFFRRRNASSLQRTIRSSTSVSSNERLNTSISR